MSATLIENSVQHAPLAKDAQTSHETTKTVTKSQQGRVFKIIVIGDSNVGKTCLTFRFCGGKFPSRTEATIGVDFREKSIEIDGELIKIQLWDTAGQERFRKSMVQHYYRNVQAIIFVYDVTRVTTFNNLPHWIEECNRHSIDMKNIPRILVGNKCDSSPSSICVQANLAQRFADQHNMPVFETSAKDDSQANHVEAIFWTLAHRLKTSKPMIVPLFEDSRDVTYDYEKHQNHILLSQRKSNEAQFHFDNEKSCSC